MVNKFETKNFEEEVEKSNKTVLVDFYADWCMPCKMMSPIIEEIAGENIDNLKVGKVNCDENPELAEKYGIMSIPTILIFKNGKVEKSLIGVNSKEQVLDAINN